ncbi:hypothetical protein PFMALIP_03619 [Plasmodium falciparum MaliPS096_E11]|uniref:Uncharacterized protein n=1 Tax=Plasmodium falciparum MaliPS096_E11 TaxID=1036727 RepID=A0A024WPB0_PLAFA|nr:hypothetical protein PFMALIP_03619 [Plasmodium falciparum MaliPS096_E11]
MSDYFTILSNIFTSTSLKKKYSSRLSTKSKKNQKRVKLIRLRNGHFRRIVDISNIDEKSIFPRSCTFASISSASKENERKNSSEDTKEPQENLYGKSNTSSSITIKINFDESDENKSDQDNHSIDTISDISFTQTSRKSLEIESNTYESYREVEKEDIEEEEEEEKEEEYEEEEEEEEYEEEEEEEEYEEEEEEEEEEYEEEGLKTEEEKEEEKEEDNKEVEPEEELKEEDDKEVEPEEEKENEQKKEEQEENNLEAPSKTLMKGVKTNIYFLSTKERIEALMCYNYISNAIIFEKGKFLRYIFMNNVNNIIVNEHMINMLCKKEKIKYILSSNSIIIESNDFIKPLIIEFDSNISKKIFVKHLKMVDSFKLDDKLYREYLNDLSEHERDRLKHVESFYSNAIKVHNT